MTGSRKRAVQAGHRLERSQVEGVRDAGAHEQRHDHEARKGRRRDDGESRAGPFVVQQRHPRSRPRHRPRRWRLGSAARRVHLLGSVRCPRRRFRPVSRPPSRTPNPGERSTIEAAGIPWSALVWGDPGARPLLLIHGVTSSAAVWWRIGPALAATERRVIAVDQAGHGRTGHWQGHVGSATTPPTSPRSSGRPVSTAADLQVVGHSWGAVTAAALPAVGLRPATLVLLDPPVLPLRADRARGVRPRRSGRTTTSTRRRPRSVPPSRPGATGDVRAKAEALIDLD